MDAQSISDSLLLVCVCVCGSKLKTSSCESKTRGRLRPSSFPQDRDVSKVRLETISRPRYQDLDYMPVHNIVLYRVIAHNVTDFKFYKYT